MSYITDQQTFLFCHRIIRSSSSIHSSILYVFCFFLCGLVSNKLMIIVCRYILFYSCFIHVCFMYVVTCDVIIKIVTFADTVISVFSISWVFNFLLFFSVYNMPV